MAITLVELGLSLGGVRTALTLDKGLRVLEQARAESLGESDPDGPSDLGVGGVAPDAAAGL